MRLRLYSVFHKSRQFFRIKKDDQPSKVDRLSMESVLFYYVTDIPINTINLLLLLVS